MNSAFKTEDQKNFYHLDMAYGYDQTQKIHSKLLLKISHLLADFKYIKGRG